MMKSNHAIKEIMLNLTLVINKRSKKNYASQEYKDLTKKMYPEFILKLSG
jgi:hypothetical protein